MNPRLYGSVLKNHRVFLLWWNVGDTAFSYIILLPISYIKSDKISRPSQKFYQGQYRTTATIRITGRPFCKNQLGRPCFCSQERTDSSCQAGSVSQNQICQCKHHIQFCRLFSQPSVSRLSVSKLTFDDSKNVFYFCPDG